MGSSRTCSVLSSHLANKHRLKCIYFHLNLIILIRGKRCGSLSGGVCAILSWLGRTGWERILLPLMKGGAYLCNLRVLLLSGNLKNANSKCALAQHTQGYTEATLSVREKIHGYKMCASNTVPCRRKAF